MDECRLCEGGGRLPAVEIRRLRDGLQVERRYRCPVCDGPEENPVSRGLQLLVAALLTAAERNGREAAGAAVHPRTTGGGS